MTPTDLSPFMMPPEPTDVGFHTGEVIEWNTDAGTNSVKVLGSVMTNLPLLTSSTVTSIAPGVTVGVLRFKSTYFVLGRVVTPDNPLAMPYTPVVMYPKFISLGTPGNGEAVRCNVGAPCQWLGVARIVQPFIWVKGLWGPYGGGTSSTTYVLSINSTDIATWTANSFDPNLKGPFQIPNINFVGYADVAVRATSFTGSGAYYFDVEGVYFTSY